MKHFTTTLLLFTLFSFCSTATNAQAGDLDSTFATNGIFVMDLGGGLETAHDVVIQPDNKILVSFVIDLDPNSSSFEAAVARFNTNGTLDSTFASNGWFHLPNPSASDHSYSLNLLDDGSILVGGAYGVSAPNTAFMILKLTANGDLDTSFGFNGTVIKDLDEGQDYIRGIDVGSDGKIYGAGESQIGETSHEKMIVISLNEDGSDNLDFGVDGLFEWNIDSFSNKISNIHVNADGSVLASGLSRPASTDMYALYKIKPDGSGLDSTFAVNGEAIPPVEGQAYGMAVHPNGNILLTGNVFTGQTIDLALIAFDQNGVLNPDFGIEGVVFTNFFVQQTGYDIAIQQDGKILVCGEQKNGGFFAPKTMFTARYTADGVVDESWGGTGGIATDTGSPFGLAFANGITVQPDGKVVAVGTTGMPSTNNDLTVIRFQNRIDVDEDGFFLGVDDCDDNNSAINPNATEITYNGIDDDCNPATLDDDLDQDGFDLADDCDDMNANIHPDAAEVVYNGIDDDCNPATLDDDLDQDGFDLADDCDDTNMAINPNATEIPYNGIDDDCNELTVDDDLDGDGWYVLNDCDDMNAGIHPLAEEIPNNDIDEDCDGEDLLVSTDELELANSFIISPNPATDLVNIRWANTDMTVEKVDLLDYTGKVLMSSQNLGTSSQAQMFVNDLPSGFYLIHIHTTDGVAVSKLVVD